MYGIQHIQSYGMNKEEYIAHIEFETAHRKKWLKQPVHTKRYIRGMLTNIIKARIHSRDTGQRTTDPAIRARVLKKTAGRCYLCHRLWKPILADILPKLYFSHLQIDHIVPFNKMGPNDISNYLAICSRCNNRKSDLSLAEFRAGVRKPAYKRK